MRQAWLRAVLWAVFALLTLTGGYVMLRACDFGVLPLFGSAACGAPSADTAQALERERQTDLRAGIHAAQIRLALLPVCPKPLPPQPMPDQDQTKNGEKFEVPKKVEDLKGCWQSARGDIVFTTDDAEQKPVGQARICYCFKSDGHGIVQVRYTDGDICRAPLVAKVKPDHVSMHHDNVYCQHHSFNVAADITCGKDQSNQTTCEIQSLGRIRNKISEQFIRVSDEYCGWNG